MRTARQLRRTLLAAGLAAGSVLAGGTVVWAAGALTQAEITACLDSNGHFFQSPEGRSCPGTSLTWNQQGPVGPTGPQGPQGPQGPAGQQGPAGKPAPANKLTVMTVKHVVKASWNGKWFDSVTPTKTAHVIGCPQGGWSATGAGFAAYQKIQGLKRLSIARLAVQEPIVSQNGTVIGFRMQVALDFAPGDYTSAQWWVDFSVVCMKLGA